MVEMALLENLLSQEVKDTVLLFVLVVQVHEEHFD
jgi:hypothetical protein